jgi:BatD DUF11 like domain
MMKPIGSQWTLIVLLLTALGANMAQGAVSASIDRNRVTLGDTLRLTIAATDDEDITDRELQPLQRDFEILQRSTSSNTSIINGRVSHSRQMTVELAPRREGNLQIPPLQFGQSTTPSLTVVVGPASDTPSDGQSVTFEAEVDHSEVYVQGQIILTLRVQQAVSLEGRSISPLKLDDAFVKPLEQHSFQRNVSGRPWLVDEIRYAIFPEHSGTLTIPAQVFSGRLEQGRRSFFDMGGSGQLVRRTTQPITINVLPKPASYPPEDWLPAQRLTLEETWSTAPENLRVGESATRTIRIVGEGLQGAQLPPILFTPTEGLKYYPDQPTISEQEIASGLEGIREDSAAVVPTRAGSYLIPEIRIPWWDTATGQLQYAVLPERTITATGVAPSGSGEIGTAPEATANPASGPAPASAIDLASGTEVTANITAQHEVRLWQILSAVSTLGWLLTFIYLRRKRTPLPQATTNPTENVSEKQAFKQLLAACAEGEAASTRAAVIAWAAAFTSGVTAVSLDQVVLKLGDEELGQLLGKLDKVLYRPGNTTWDPEALAACVRRLRKDATRGNRSSAEQPLQLYPTA